MTSERQLDDACTIFGLFVGMTYHFRPVCGIGPVVGIGLFRGPGPVVSLTFVEGLCYLYSLTVVSLTYIHQKRDAEGHRHQGTEN